MIGIAVTAAAGAGGCHQQRFWGLQHHHYAAVAAGDPGQLQQAKDCAGHCLAWRQ